MSVSKESPPSNSLGHPRAKTVVPHEPRWFQWVGAWVVVTLVRIVGATLRYRWHDESNHVASRTGGPAIYATWHNRLALSMAAYYGYVHRHTATSGLAALVSASKDGAFLAAILRCFRVQPVRGSSSRRGHQALLELTTWADRGFDLAITPDGPRGPCYKVQDGVMSLSQVTGKTIIPFSCHIRWKVSLKSWDRFQIPLPFSVCEMRFGPPIRVPRDASAEGREALRQTLEKSLDALSRDSSIGVS